MLPSPSFFGAIVVQNKRRKHLLTNLLCPGHIWRSRQDILNIRALTFLHTDPKIPMSDTEQNEGGDITGAAAQGSEDNSILETLMAEIEKLKNENKQTKQALSAVTGNHGEASTSSNNAPYSPAQTPQVVYVSRERKIQKFSGIRKTDNDTVENLSTM